MRATQWADTGVKPPRHLAIDLTHPLARGLELALIFNEGGGRVFDYARRARIGVPTNGPVWSPRCEGSLDFSGTSFVTVAEPLDAPYLGDISLLWRGIVDTGSAFRHFAGKHAGSGATTAPFDYRTTNAATPVVHLVRANGAGNREYDGHATVLGVKKSYGVSAPTPIETAPTFYLDGSPLTGTPTGGVGSGAPTGSGANINIGRRADGAVQMDGAVELFFAWSRVLLPREWRQLHYEPYAFFMPDYLNRLMIDPPASPGPTGLPAGILLSCGHPMFSDCDSWLLK